MKPPLFAYCAPESLNQALSLLQQHQREAQILAGGQSLMPLLNLRVLRPSVLIDLNNVAELAGCVQVQDTLVVGAMTRQCALESDSVRSIQPLLSAAAELIGSFPIRNRGTVGGSLAAGSPIGELPAVALALDAQLVAASAGAPPRTIAAADFFRGAQQTALAPSEILTSARFPILPPHTGWSIREITQRQSGPALAGAVSIVTVDTHRQCVDARFVVFAVQDRPARLTAVEQFLVGQEITPAALDGIAAAAAAQVTDALRTAPCLSDSHASADYRREVTAVLARQALTEAMQRAIHSER